MTITNKNLTPVQASTPEPSATPVAVESAAPSVKASSKSFLHVVPSDNGPEVSLNLPALGPYGGVAMTLTLLSGLAWKYIFQPRVDGFNRSLSRSLELDKLKMGTIYKILSSTSAHRVILLEPHNGTIFASGAHDFKLSCTVEACNPGVANYKHRLQHIKVTDIIDSLDKLIERGQLDFLSTADMDDRISAAYTDMGAYSTRAIALYKNKSNLLAVLSISFPNKEATLEMSEEKLATFVRELRSNLLSTQTNIFTGFLRYVGGNN
jgi:hypothetical protein